MKILILKRYTRFIPKIQLIRKLLLTHAFQRLLTLSNDKPVLNRKTLQMRLYNLLFIVLKANEQITNLFVKDK